ncbi:hypothetical protein DBV33_12735 [Pseudomonas fluorescens]|nr:hypothetical protein DBV33_12735 [Pseudomonas fluorescens]
MQFAVALIEYLISGIVASAWLAAILNEYYPFTFADIKAYKEIFIIVYLPVAYILGIYVDTTSSFFIRRAGEIASAVSKVINVFPLFANGFKFLIRTLLGTPKPDSYKKSAAILARSVPDAVRTMDAYVSRDRIARGATFNAFAGGITALFYAPVEHKHLIIVVCILAFVYSYMMHKRLRRLSSRFKEEALKNLREIQSTEAGKTKKQATADA